MARDQMVLAKESKRNLPSTSDSDCSAELDYVALFKLFDDQYHIVCWGPNLDFSY